MSNFNLVIEASVNAAGGSAPTLDILIGGTPVASSTAITSVTGVGADLLLFTLDYSGNYPSSLSFRFNGGSGDPGDIVRIESVRINGQALSPGALTGILIAQGASQSVASTAAHDHLFGRVEPTGADLGSATHNGTGGNDNVSGSGSSDVIDAGAGDDLIRALADDDAIIAGDGNDTVYGENGNDIIIGGLGADRIYGNAGDDLIFGQDDNDTISGGAGNDTLNGGSGDDIIMGNQGDDILIGEDGDDRLMGITGNNTMYGDAGSDTIFGGTGDDVMYGGADNDRLNGNNGDDTLFGDAGDDFLFAGNGADTLDGGADNDFLSGGAGDDTLSGDTGNDQLFGDAGSDTLNGGTGDDNLVGGDGADTLNGDAGNDILQGSGLDSWEVSAILAANPNVIFSNETNSFYQLVSTSTTFHGAQGVAGATTLNGVSGHLVTISSSIENTVVDTLANGNQIWINASDSSVEGEWRWAGGQEDGLLLWNGDSSGSAINGFFTNWNGGEPNDSGGNEDAAVMLASGLWNDADASGSNFYVIEWDGNEFSDDNASDVLNGGNDDDLLLGHGGNDQLYGDNGIDHLFGGDGDDQMHGGNGDDFLYDDNGANEFYGDSGNDTLDARFQTAIPSIADQITAILTENPALSYSPDTGNFYELVNTNVSWDNAVANSAASLINGIGGHLVTITSQEENDFVESIHLGNDIWLGASDRDTEGVWIWMVGPEAGQQFWQGTSGGTSVGGLYSNWDGGEPNDYGGGEDYATMWQGGGNWNDNGPPNQAGFTVDYIIEWEGSELLVTPPIETPQSAQLMYGGDGDDTIYGGNGDDSIFGEANNDTVEAGDGDDTVNGDDGNDTLFGGLGNDVINGGNGNDTMYANAAPSATAIPLNATFDANSDGFTYADGAPWGGGDAGGINVSGPYVAGDGYAANGSIEVNFNATGTNSNSSGSWSISVNLSNALDALQLSFAYRMNLATQTDNNENLFLYADIDGTQYGANGNAYVDALFGNSVDGDTGWRTVTLDIGALTSGSHTLTLGGYFPQSNNSNEDGWIRFDDVVLSNSGAGSTDENASNTLNGDAGNDTLYGSTGTDTLNGGAGDDIIYSGSAAGYAVADALADNPNAVYDAATGNFYEYVNGNTDYFTAAAAASSSTLNGVSGHLATITSAAENTFIQGILGGDSWLGGDDATTEGAWTWNVGPEAGTQFSNGGTAVGGMYTNWAGGQPNNFNGNQDHFTIDSGTGTWADFDSGSSYDYVIEWEGADVLATGNPTILNGGSGANTLYGSDGMDVFYFANGTQADGYDTINDWDTSTGDVLDISDILTSAGYDAVNDAITDFVDIIDYLGNSVIFIDTSGSASFTYTPAGAMAVITGVTGLTDETALEAAGTLVTI